MIDDEVPTALTTKQRLDRGRLVAAVKGTANPEDPDDFDAEAHDKAREDLEEFDERIRRSIRDPD